ncbi:MAG: non-ribosomal peptide synthetase, partial [Chromatiales bacterium]
MLLTTAWVCLIVLVATFAAWRRYLWVRTTCERDAPDSCAFSLTDRFSDHHLKNVPHQDGVRWLHEVFERSARRFPQNEALHVPNTGQRLTYEALDRRAEQVAGALTRHVTGPDQVVVVAMDQDDWHIVAAHLGILKCGAVTLFLDSRLPDALVERMLADAAPVAMLTRGEPGLRGIPVIDVLNLEHAAVRRVVPAWLEDPARSLATLFYTSGTTGMPKGVECHHAGYVNLALTYADYFDLVPGMDATSLTSSLGYDGSISEMYGAWVSGCSVVLLTGEEVRSGPDLLPILRAAEVTVLFCPPALLPTLTSSPATDLPYPLCRYIVPAGEAFPEALVEPWTRGRRQVINTYGPTEASTDTSRQSLRPGEPVTIGSPFPNVTYVILPFGGMAPLPHGEAGELCIGGVHLAHGYRNQPEQTAEKFIDHPRFGRLYRTGDKCRIDIHSQRVEFLGREDVQIKVRGHRVEIQPIEDLLQSQFSEIDAAVVDYQNEELIAFVAASSMLQGDDPECLPAPPQWNARVLDRLAGQLPAIAVPSRLFLVRKFALQALSGKIDRRQLPLVTAVVEDSGIDNRKGSRDTPALAGMIADDGTVLQICRDVFATDLGWDDVFADHGGHSIVIARLAQRLQADGWKVTVRDLLSDLDTARKIAEQAERPALTVDSSQKAPPGQAGPVVGDAAMRQVLGVKWFTTLQCLLILLIYAPAVMGIILVTVAVEWDQFLTTASLLEFVALGILGYLLTLCLPFVNLIWVMLLKFVTGGHPREYHIAPGIYPKWSRMHLRLWFVGR